MVDKAIIDVDVKLDEVRKGQEEVDKLAAKLDGLKKDIDKLRVDKGGRIFSKDMADLDKLDRKIEGIQQAIDDLGGPRIDWEEDKIKRVTKLIIDLGKVAEKVNSDLKEIVGNYNQISKAPPPVVTTPSGSRPVRETTSTSTPRSRAPPLPQEIELRYLLPPGTAILGDSGGKAVSRNKTLEPLTSDRANKQLVDSIITSIEAEDERARKLYKSFEIYVANQKGSFYGIPFEHIVNRHRTTEDLQKNRAAPIDRFIESQYKYLEGQGVNVNWGKRKSYYNIVHRIGAVIDAYDIKSRKDLDNVAGKFIKELETGNYDDVRGSQLINILGRLELARRSIIFPGDNTSTMYQLHNQQGRTLPHHPDERSMALLYELRRNYFSGARPKEFVMGSQQVQPLLDGQFYQSYNASINHLIDRGLAERMVRNITKGDLPKHLMGLNPEQIFSILSQTSLAKIIRLTPAGQEYSDRLFGLDEHPVDLPPQLNLSTLSNIGLDREIVRSNFELKPGKNKHINEYIEALDYIVNYGTEGNEKGYFKDIIDGNVAGMSPEVTAARDRFVERYMNGELGSNINREIFQAVLNRSSDEKRTIQEGAISQKLQWDSVSPMSREYGKNISNDVFGKEKWAEDSGVFFGSRRLLQFAHSSEDAVGYLRDIGKVLDINADNLRMHKDYIGLHIDDIYNIMDNVGKLLVRATPISRGEVAGTMEDQLEELDAVQEVLERFPIFARATNLGWNQDAMLRRIEEIDNANVARENQREDYRQFYAAVLAVQHARIQAAADRGERLIFPPIIPSRNPVQAEMSGFPKELTEGDPDLYGASQSVKSVRGVKKPTETEIPEEGKYEPGHWWGNIREDTFNMLKEKGYNYIAGYGAADANTRNMFMKKWINPRYGDWKKFARGRGIGPRDTRSVERELSKEFRKYIRMVWDKTTEAKRAQIAWMVMQDTAISNRIPLTPEEINRIPGKGEFMDDYMDMLIHAIVSSQERLESSSYGEDDSLSDYRAYPQGFTGEALANIESYDIYEDAPQLSLYDKLPASTVGTSEITSDNRAKLKRARNVTRTRTRVSNTRRSLYAKLKEGFKKHGKTIALIGGAIALSTILPQFGIPAAFAGIPLMMGTVRTPEAQADVDKELAEIDALLDPNTGIISKLTYAYDKAGAQYDPKHQADLIKKLTDMGYSIRPTTVASGSRKSTISRIGGIVASKAMTSGELRESIGELEDVFKEARGHPEQIHIGRRVSLARKKLGTEASDKEVEQALIRESLALDSKISGPRESGLVDITRKMRVSGMSDDEVAGLQEKIRAILGEGATVVSSGRKFSGKEDSRLLTIRAGRVYKGKTLSNITKWDPVTGQPIITSSPIDELDELLTKTHTGYGGKGTITSEDIASHIPNISQSAGQNFIDSIMGPSGKTQSLLSRAMKFGGGLINKPDVPRTFTEARFSYDKAPSPKMLSDMEAAYGKLMDNVRVTTHEYDEMSATGEKLHKVLVKVNGDLDPGEHAIKSEKIKKLGDSFDSVSGSTDHATTSTEKYGKSYSRLERSGNFFTKSAGAFRNMAWSMTFLNMSFLGVAFSMQGLANMLMRAITTIFSPVMDLNSMFETLGMAMAFGDEKSQELAESMDPNRLVQGWQNLQGILAAIGIEMIDLAMMFLTDQEWVDGIIDGIHELFEILKDPDVVEAIKTIITKVVDALPGVAAILPGLADVITRLSEVKIGDNSLLDWLVTLGALSPIVLPAMSIISAGLSGLAAVCGILGINLRVGLPLFWGFIKWLSKWIATFAMKGLIALGVGQGLAMTAATILGGLTGGLILGMIVVYLMLKAGILDWFSNLGGWVQSMAMDNPLLAAFLNLFTVLATPFTVLGVIIIDLLSGQLDKVGTHLKMIALKLGMIWYGMWESIFRGVPFDLGKGIADSMKIALGQMQNEYNRLEMSAPLLRHDNIGETVARRTQEAQAANPQVTASPPPASPTYNPQVPTQVIQTNTMNIGNITNQGDLDDAVEQLRTAQATTPRWA